MIPTASLLCTTTSTSTTPTSTPPKPKLGFSIDSLVGLSRSPPPPKNNNPKPSKPINRRQHLTPNKHAKHFKGVNNGGDFEIAGSREFRSRDVVLSEDFHPGDYRGEFRTDVCSPEDVRNMRHQMENIQQALYHINRNKRNNQHLSSPSSSSSSPSPPARKPSSSPKQHHQQRGVSSPRRRSPPPSPNNNFSGNHYRSNNNNNNFLHQQHHALSPPVSSPLPTHSPLMSSPISSSGSSIRIPEPIHPLNSSPLPLSLSNSLSNHLGNPLSNPLNFPPFGLPLSALLPQIRPGYQHPSLQPPNIPTSQELHNSLCQTNESSHISTSSLSGGLSSASLQPLTTACLTNAHLVASNGLPTGLSSNGPPHHGLIQTALPASWGPGGFGHGALGPSLMAPHGLGTPLPPANMPRQYPVYPWLLTRHNRLFGHRFPGPDFPTFLLPFRKPKRIRTAFSPSQLLKLEQAFEKNQYVVGQERKQLAQTLNLSETQVKVWFQNRRTKHKRVVHDGDDEENPSGQDHERDEDGDPHFEDEEEEEDDEDGSPSTTSTSIVPGADEDHEERREGPDEDGRRGGGLLIRHLPHTTSSTTTSSSPMITGVSDSVGVGRGRGGDNPEDARGLGNRTYHLGAEDSSTTSMIENDDPCVDEGGGGRGNVPNIINSTSNSSNSMSSSGNARRRIDPRSQMQLDPAEERRLGGMSSPLASETDELSRLHAMRRAGEEMDRPRSRSPMEVEQRRSSAGDLIIKSESPNSLDNPCNTLPAGGRIPDDSSAAYLAAANLITSASHLSNHSPIHHLASQSLSSLSSSIHFNTLTGTGTPSNHSIAAMNPHLMGVTNHSVASLSLPVSAANTVLGLTVQRMTDCSTGN